ncbi:medium-chain acyl-CoA ligase ACSF2, mitochondrial-like [Phlebotomus argentipes]|uniref:medium-chain acyl-CoA ligase ACSF2, mitochondrial-like n=1 Tax=Phlebotomus argentipes TaxID=94469 RepID=UPI002892F41E|nr:medium-chain acyl-CoA ligase ACSF2, mitochondrial-like [Phlebotomus argentipes]
MEVVIRSVKVISSVQKVYRIGLRRSHTKPSNLSYIHNIGKHPLVYRTIGQELARVADECGDREAIVSVDEQKRLTFAQIRSEADRLAAGFQTLGLARGDRVGIWAPNVISWPVVMFAAARAGIILVALNPAYEAAEMQFCLQKVGIKTLVTSESFRSQSYHEKLLKIVPELEKSSGKIHSSKFPSLSSIIIDSEKHFPGTLRLCDVTDMATATQISAIEDQQKQISPDTGCNIQFTSGTTGMPKAALMKHFGFVNNGIHIGNRNELYQKRLCMQVPFFHAFGTVITVMACLSHKATIVIPATMYNPEKSLRAIRDEQCSVIYGTPTMYVDLVNKQREMNLELKAEIAVTGGALCSPQLFKDMKKELGLKKVKTVFGMTENTAVSFNTLYEDTDEQILETVGHVQDHIEVKVIDAEGNLVPFGTPGELCVRGYFTMLRYWDEEQKTSEALVDGWLHTGDQFVLQADGYGRIVGRLKEMIIRGGENIFPKEIENFLATCPQIAEAHIVGVPDERLGEEMCAFVRLRSGSEIFTPDDIRAYCKGKISFFKIPRYIEIVTEFPKTLSGKIQKFKLQEQFKVKSKN